MSMPALNFQKQFAPKVESGEKKQTIRANRKDGRDLKPGDTLYLYTGMRTKTCRKLGEAEAKSVHDVKIDERGTMVDGIRLDPLTLKHFAQADGFSCVKDYLNFFTRTHGLPFRGKLIRW